MESDLHESTNSVIHLLNRHISSVSRWLLLFGLGTIVLEAATRFEDWVRFGVPLNSRVASANDLIVTDTVGPRGRPNAKFGRWQLNSMGFHGPESSLDDHSAVLRIVTAGSSETFGLYESAGKEYPRQLQDSLGRALSERCPANAPRIEVINAALPGMALPSLSSHLDNVVRRLKPDLIILYPSPGFYLNMTPPRLTTSTASDTSLPASRILHLRALDRVVAQVKSLLPSRLTTALRQLMIDRAMAGYEEGTKYVTVPTDRLQRFDSDLRHTVGIALSISPSVVLVGHVNATMAPRFDNNDMLIAWERQLPRATGSVITQFHNEALRIIQRAASDSGVPYVDLKRALDGLEWSEAFADFVHFTDAGAGIVSATVKQAVLDFIDCNGVRE